jgi:tol-pal system-associated acyl-CoA thioesterase
VSETFYCPIQVYYEDTDHSGVVYYANYLKYFERGREHAIGVDELLRLGGAGSSFVVAKVEVTYREGARFGEKLVVRSRARCESEFRLRFLQDVLREGSDKVMVAGVVDLVCVNESRQLAPLPDSVFSRFQRAD